MKKALRKQIAALCAATLLGTFAASAIACGPGDDVTDPEDEIIPDPGYSQEKPPEESPFDDYDDPSNPIFGGGSGSTIGKTSGDEKFDYFDSVADANSKQATYRQYTVTTPSTWNTLDSMDQNDQQIMAHLGSSFFEFDYKLDRKSVV